MSAETVQKGNAIHDRHRQVQQHQIDVLGLDDAERFQSVSSDKRRVPGKFQHRCQRVTEDRHIVNNENCGHDHSHSIDVNQ
jgi:hypothetical protein